MEINIKKIGTTLGTIGWLKRGLESGDLFLEEGTLKSNGNHGLWLKSRDGSINQFMAAYNVYGLSYSDGIPSALQYKPAVKREDGLGIWTDAAWGVIREIAEDWCDQLNSERENDAYDGCFEIKRVLVKTEG